jgi:hypothetical protein
VTLTPPTKELELLGMKGGLLFGVGGGVIFLVLVICVFTICYFKNKGENSTIKAEELKI